VERAAFRDPEPDLQEDLVRVLILGGDGFCGWPTSLELSERGHDVVIVDNFARRNADVELEVSSLTPIEPLGKRMQAWREVSGREIDFRRLNVAEDYEQLLDLLAEFRPDAVVHFAEQRAAPYSMKSSWHKRYTVTNNLNATHNLLAALVESGTDAQVVHLGTMGVYGYGAAGVKIPEGYLQVKMEAEDGTEVSQEILYPANPGSVYHMTKTQDQLLFAFYNKNDEIGVTDLHQGIVWGTQTSQTRRDARLINRFDYDGDYGTVLNRFLMQSAIGYPLTVHGTGGQTRAFIHIQDTVRCVALAIENPPARGERVRIFNQMTETHRVIDLAKIVSRLTGAQIDLLENPRNEASENDLFVENRQLLALGLEPITLEDGLLREVTEIAERYAHRCERDKIPCRSVWNRPRADDFMSELADPPPVLAAADLGDERDGARLPLTVHDAS
jgi:UDP-sulfoquinovose synthase